MTSYATPAQVARARELLDKVNSSDFVPPSNHTFRPCFTQCDNPACCEVRCLGPMSTQLANQENPVTDHAHAPFDDDTRAALRAWQDCAWTHPLTCGQCHSALPLIPEKRGLVCPSCFHAQEAVPAECLTLPENPAAILAANAKAEDETD